MCAPKPPKPDPLIGQSAKQNSDIAQQQLDVAKEQLLWEKDRAKVQDPLIQKVVDQQIAAGDANASRAESQWQIYRDLFAPVEERMVKDANEFDSPERQERMAGQAGADVTRGFQGAFEQNQRQMERMGINPNSGRFQGLNNETSIAQAKDTAGAMNKARRDTELQGMAMRQNAVQTGRGLPTTGIAADSAALNAGNSGVGNINAGNAAHNAGLGAAQGWFGGATAGNNSAGNLMLGLNQAGLQSWDARQGQLAGYGQLLGAGAGAAAMFLKDGGMIRGNTAYSRKPGRYSGALGALKRRGYAAGGLIQGPGTGTSDSIPATIEGQEPIQVSNGEAVLNEAAVQLVGEDFIHRINAGGLAMLEKGGR